MYVLFWQLQPKRIRMAIKPTIYKLKIALSDLNQDHYDNLDLTIALHPSETTERMMARVLAYCLNAQPQLVFCKGLSDTSEPDLWAHSLDGNLETWIEVGEPSEDRIKKASHRAPTVKIYSFNSKSPTWWDLECSKLKSLTASIYRFYWNDMVTLASFVERTMDLSITISDNSVYVATRLGECEMTLQTLQEQSPG
jgi:uncharacterized protein YaeQ